MAIDFPSSPTVGQSVTIGGVTWTWDGVKWTAAGTGVGVYLPLTGGTMTGDLILNRDPQVALGAATKQSVDARGAGDNRIINGDMRIDQRNNGASGTAGGYTVDRWQYAASVAAKGTWQRITAPAVSGLSALGFGYDLSFTSSSAYALLAGDYFTFTQLIEADMISDFAWGTNGAQPVTLSFWAMSSLTGTFGGALRNVPVTRCYPFSYSIPVANIWTKIVITIPGDTAGTWVMNGNAQGVSLNFGLGVGSTISAPAGAWVSGNYLSANGAVSVVGTNGATFFLTGVKLEIGSVATPFNRQSLAKSMADCQRYYQIGQLFHRASAGAGAGFSTASLRPVAMRANATMAITTNTSINITGFALADNGFSFNGSGAAIAAGDTLINVVFSASAEL